MNRSPQKTYFWRPGRHGDFWKRVTRRVGPQRAGNFGLRAAVEKTGAGNPTFSVRLALGGDLRFFRKQHS
jgi:hypothetical protein